ncbi:MAG: sigma-70 family RNA polymerase sigma factor [Myxococcota bacterium]
MALAKPSDVERSDSPGSDVAAAFRTFFDTHVSLVWRTLALWGVPEADLADVAQEVFTVVATRWHAYDASRGSRKSWLYGIARNAARAHGRSRQRAPELAELEGLAVVPDAAAALDAKRQFARLRQLVGELSESQREVFILHDLEGFEMGHIAEVLSIPRATGYSRLRLARARLARRLAQRRVGSAEASPKRSVRHE